ncbi:MAG: hypothetical protein ACP5LI_05220 [Hydrogenobaculum sp.]
MRSVRGFSAKHDAKKYTKHSLFQIHLYGPSDGSDALPNDSGFQRLFVAPGIEYKFGNYDVSADIQLPIYTHVNGYQLVAPYMFSANVSYSF